MCSAWDRFSRIKVQSRRGGYSNREQATCQLALRAHDPARKLKNPTNPKIAKKHQPDIQIPITARDRTNTGKYPKNMIRVFWGYSGGYLKGYLRESHILYVGGYFCISWASHSVAGRRVVKTCPLLHHISRPTELLPDDCNDVLTMHARIAFCVGLRCIAFRACLWGRGSCASVGSSCKLLEI